MGPHGFPIFETGPHGRPMQRSNLDLKIWQLYQNFTIIDVFVFHQFSKITVASDENFLRIENNKS
jgi:hypothetical protein